jgi:hypothetical protein
MPWVKTVSPLSEPYPFCGTTLIVFVDGRLVQSPVRTREALRLR